MDDITVLKTQKSRKNTKILKEKPTEPGPGNEINVGVPYR